MSPRARDERCAKHRLLEYFLDGCLGSRLFVRSRPCFHGLSLGKKWKWLGHTHTETTGRVERVVFGGTLWSQNSLFLHNEQDLSIAIPYRPKQVHSTFRGASSVPSPWFFGWDICSGLSSSFGVLTACSADSLTQASLPSLTQGVLNRFTATGFLIHSSCPCLDSWKFVEIHWPVRAPLVCSISGVFSWRTGMGRFSWALEEDPCTKPPPCVVWNNMGFPSCIPVFFYFCRYRFELVLLHVRGRRKLLVDDGLCWVGSDSSLLVCRDQLRPSFRPWVTVA